MKKKRSHCPYLRPSAPRPVPSNSIRGDDWSIRWDNQLKGQPGVPDHRHQAQRGRPSVYPNAHKR